MYITPKHAQFMRFIGYFLVTIGNKLIQLYTPKPKVIIPVQIERVWFPLAHNTQITIEVKSCSHS